ncbi:MAG: hypothetical protein K2Y27_01475 [Xanthobacteraceae bacterium]|nr:hypothetical protein [Xanthobacteraceae bacterium]
MYEVQDRANGAATRLNGHPVDGDLRNLWLHDAGARAVIVDVWNTSMIRNSLA